MLYATTPAAEKRRSCASGSPRGAAALPRRVQPAVARLIERKGFDGVYISGAVLSADLGLPDIGLTTLTEVAGAGSRSPG
jgi:methylisocitrate lyase